MIILIPFSSGKPTFIISQLASCQQAGDAILNPKVTMIIRQCFPLIIQRHEKGPISEEASIGRGYDAIRKLPDDEKERDQKEIDTAFQEAVEKIHTAADRKRLLAPDSGSGDESSGTKK